MPPKRGLSLDLRFRVSLCAATVTVVGALSAVAVAAGSSAASRVPVWRASRVSAGNVPATPLWKPAAESGTLAGDAFTAELQTVDLNGDGLRDAVIERWIYDRLELFPLTILLNRGGGRFVD